MKTAAECVCTGLSSVITEAGRYRWLIIYFISLRFWVCYYFTLENWHLRLGVYERVCERQDLSALENNYCSLV